MAVSYYITARQQLGASVKGSEEALTEKIRGAFSAGVDYVQVREKNLPARRLAALVEKLASCGEKKNTRLLVNDRWDIAVTCGADGVHLPSDSLPPSVLRPLLASSRPGMVAGISCHNAGDVAEAARYGASYVLLGPVFETPSKPGVKPLGLAVIAEICRRSPIPIYALGGVSAANAEECVRAGAAGVAGIRLFQEASDLSELCGRLRLL